MTDQLERDLTTLLHRRAADTAPSPVPLDRLRQQGEAEQEARRRRTRLLTVGAVAAAVVLAIATPIGFRSLTGDDSAPAPAEIPEVVNTSTERPESIADLPVGPPPVMPYLVGQTLHFGGDTYDLPRSLLSFGNQGAGDQVHAVDGAVVLIDQRSVATQGNQTARIFLGEDGEITPLLDVTLHHSSGFSTGLVVSDDGSVLATASRTDDGGDLVTSYAIPSGEQIGHVEVSARRLGLIGADDHGRVFWATANAIFMWEPGQQPRQLDLPTGSAIVGVTSDKVVLVGGNGFEVGGISADAEFVPEHSLTDPPEGSVFMIDGANTFGSLHARRVTDLATGDSVELLIPDAAAAAASVVAVEGRQNVLVVAHEQNASLLRCSLTTGACDRTLSTLPADALVRLPVGRRMLPLG